MDELPLSERVAGKILSAQARVCGGQPFVHCDSRWHTFTEMNHRANRVANAFAMLGIGKGARVAILLRNRVEYLDLWFGLSKLGAIQMPLNNDYKAAQILHSLQRSRVDLIVAEARRASMRFVALVHRGQRSSHAPMC